MSLHYARLKTREELQEIMCCTESVNNIISFFGNNNLIVQGNLKIKGPEYTKCRCCGHTLDYNEIHRIAIYPDKWINSRLIDIDESPIDASHLTQQVENDGVTK